MVVCQDVVGGFGMRFAAPQEVRGRSAEEVQRRLVQALLTGRRPME